MRPPAASRPRRPPCRGRGVGHRLQLDLHAAIRTAVVELPPGHAHRPRIDGHARRQGDGARDERLARIAALHDDVPQDGLRPGVHGDPQIDPRGGLADDRIDGGA